MGIGRPSSFLYSPEGAPGGGPGAECGVAPSEDLAALTAALSTAAVESLDESFPSVTRGYEGMLAAVKKLTDADIAGVNFEALESALARSFSVAPARLGHALCDFVFHDEEVVRRSDFPQIYRLLLLYVGRLPSRVPGFHYKREAAEAFVTTEGSDQEAPFTGFHHLSRTCLLRFDIKGSVQKRLKKGLSMVGTTEEHYYGLILTVLKRFPAVHYAETAGDETVFLCDDPEIALEFAREVQRCFVAGGEGSEGSQISVEMGITLNGPAYWGITTDGRFIVGGPSYDIAGKVQKLGKAREADDVGAASGIFVYDCDRPPSTIEETPSLEEYEESIGADSASLSLIDESLSVLSGSAVRMPTVREEDVGVSSISMRRLNGRDPQLVSKLQKVLALLASTATDPEGALQDREVLYPNSTILFFDFVPPVSNDSDEPDASKLQAQWEIFMQSIEKTVRRHDGVVLYNSSEGKVIVLMGAFQSSPLRQERRAVLCAAELLERFPEVLKRVVCTQDRLAQGPMAGSLNGAGLGIDFASRLLSVEAPGRLVMERDFFQTILAGSDLLFLEEHVGSYPVRDFGDRRLVSFEGVKAPTSDLSSGVEYAHLLEGISAYIQDCIRRDASAVVQSIATQADRGVSPHEFLQVLKENLARGGATVFSPSEAVQPHRAYGFFREVFTTVFSPPYDFEQFLSRHPGPHEVWRFLFREISSGRISTTLLQNADLVVDSLCSLLCAVASDRSLVLELPAWSRLDAFSIPILEALLRQPATTGHIVFLSAEPLPLDGHLLSTPPATIPLDRLNKRGLRVVLAAELGVSPDSFSGEVVGFYEQLIGAAPWVPFLVRSLTRFLLKEQYLARGRSEFIKSPSALSPEDVPGSFEHYTHSLYTGLSPHGQAVFRVAALFGARGEISILRVLAGIEEHEFNHAMSELQQAGIVRFTGKDYSFLHEFIPRIAPRLFVEADSTSAINEKILMDLCSLADLNPLAVDPHVLIEKASAAGFPQRVAPQIAEALDAMVRDLPLDAETLAKQYLSSLEGIELSSDQKMAVLRVSMHFILAKAQLRRPYDAAFRQLVSESDALRQRLPAALKSTLDAEWGLLLHDAGDVLREKDLARTGATMLMTLPEEGFGGSLRNEIEVAKARIDYRQKATPNTLPYEDRVAAAKGALIRVESVLSNSVNLSQADVQRFRVWSFVFRGFLAVDLLHGTLQTNPRSLSPEEDSVIDALIVEISDFCDQSGDILALRERMGCTHILSKGNTLRQRFDQAHAVLDDLWERVEQDGQLGFKVPLMNLKMVTYGEELKQLKANRDVESILRLADTLKPFVEFIEEHRTFLTADESLLVFYLNLIEFNADVFEALPSEHLRRPVFLEEAQRVLSQRIPDHCAKHVERYSASFNHAKKCFARMV